MLPWFNFPVLLAVHNIMPSALCLQRKLREAKAPCARPLPLQLPTAHLSLA